MKEALSAELIKEFILDNLSAINGPSTPPVHICEDTNPHGRGVLIIRVIRKEGDAVISISSMNEEPTKAGPFMYMVDWMSLADAVVKLM